MRKGRLQLRIIHKRFKIDYTKRATNKSIGRLCGDKYLARYGLRKIGGCFFFASASCGLSQWWPQHSRTAIAKLLKCSLVSGDAIRVFWGSVAAKNRLKSAILVEIFTLNRQKGLPPKKHTTAYKIEVDCYTTIPTICKTHVGSRIMRETATKQEFWCVNGNSSARSSVVVLKAAQRRPFLDIR